MVLIRKLTLQQRFSPYLELGIAYFQYLGLVHQIDISWPNLWNTILKWVSISTLLSSFSLGSDSPSPSSSLLDARAHFLLLTILLPLSLSFIMLIFAKPFYIILWFFVLLLGVGLLAAGGGLVLLDIGGAESRKILFGVGGASVFICVCIFIVRHFVNRFQWKQKVVQLKDAMRAKRAEREREKQLEREAKEKEKEQEQEKEREKETSTSSSSEGSVTDSPSVTLRPLISPSVIPLFQPPARQHSSISTPNITNRVLDKEKEEEKEAFENAQNYKADHSKRKGALYLLSRLLAVAVLVFVGMTIWGYFDSIPTSIPIPAFDSLRPIFGPILVGLGGVLLLYLIINCHPYWRRKIGDLKTFLEGRFVWMMIFALTLLYIPFTTTAMGALRCVTMNCGQGTQPPVTRQLLLDNAVTPSAYSSLSDGCQTCNFVNNCTIADTLCMPSSAKRLAIDLSQPCNVNIIWMIPVAVIAGLAITIGTPLLFYRLVVKHTRLLENIPAEGSDQEKWEIWCSTTRNSAKMLYYGFEYKWRFFRILLVIQRLVLSVVTIFLFRESTILMYITFIVHAIYFLCTFFVRPYRNLGVDGMAIGTGAGLVAICSIGIFILTTSSGDSNGSEHNYISSLVAILMVVLVILVPIGTSCFMVYLQTRKNRRTVAPLTLPNVELGEKVKEVEKKGDKEIGEKEKEGKEKEGKDNKGEEEKLDVVDIIINEFTLKTMSNFFIVVGVLAFISLAVAIVGILNSNSNLYVVAPVLGEAGDAEAQFAGYTSWAEFTQNCCCSQSESTSIETWKCLNGYYKERIRETTGRNKMSGLSMRSFCNVTFENIVCSIPSTSTNFKAVLCEGNSMEDYVISYLW